MPLVCLIYFWKCKMFDFDVKMCSWDSQNVSNLYKKLFLSEIIFRNLKKNIDILWMKLNVLEMIPNFSFKHVFLMFQEIEKKINKTFWSSKLLFLGDFFTDRFFVIGDIKIYWYFDTYYIPLLDI